MGDFDADHDRAVNASCINVAFGHMAGPLLREDDDSRLMIRKLERITPMVQENTQELRVHSEIQIGSAPSEPDSLRFEAINQIPWVTVSSPTV